MSKTNRKRTKKSGLGLVAARWWPPAWPGHRHGMIDLHGIYMYRLASTVGRVPDDGEGVVVLEGEWIVRNDDADKALVGVCKADRLVDTFGKGVREIERP